jgi:hypothetical protein
MIPFLDLWPRGAEPIGDPHPMDLEYADTIEDLSRIRHLTCR